MYEKKYNEEEAREIGNRNLNRNGCTGLEINLEGNKINNLTVVKKIRRLRRSTFEYECLCECGEVVIAQSNGNRLSKKSCRNCIVFAPSWRKGKLNAVVDKFSTLRHRYKKGAHDRGYLFELNREEFEKIIQEPCYYCDSHLQSKQMYNNREMVYYTGIDRVDNSLGYNVNNCVACCKICNNLKKAVSKEIIEKAYNFLFGKKE